MIGFLKGQIFEMNEDSIVLNVNNVGYDVHVSTQTLSQIGVGQELSVLVHTVVREDAFLLFGFLSSAEKRLFLSLLKVNGVGPKLAMNVLSGAPLSRIVEFIENSDVKGLTSLPKVGKKTAEQMILSLKGQLVNSDDRAATEKTPLRTEISSALVNLGFKPTDVDKVVAEMQNPKDLETGIRQGLRALTK